MICIIIIIIIIIIIVVIMKAVVHRPPSKGDPKRGDPEKWSLQMWLKGDLNVIYKCFCCSDAPFRIPLWGTVSNVHSCLLRPLLTACRKETCFSLPLAAFCQLLFSLQLTGANRLEGPT